MRGVIINLARFAPDKEIGVATHEAIHLWLTLGKVGTISNYKRGFDIVRQIDLLAGHINLCPEYAVLTDFHGWCRLGCGRIVSHIGGNLCRHPALLLQRWIAF